MGRVNLSDKSGAAATAYVLGLDLGPKSAGWILLDNQKREIVAAGARVFPEGVDRDPRGGEQAKNQARREKRGLRRQIQRRAQRLTTLREALASVGLLPDGQAAQESALGADPYALRAKALDERLEPYELGRVLFQLAQRRGFLSNRKAERRDGKEAGKVLGGIAELKAAMAEGDSLGRHLHRLGLSKQRIRGRYTERGMLDSEFERIWDTQRAHYPELLTEQLKYGSQGKRVYPTDNDRERKRSEPLLQRHGLHGLIFFQRRIYWPKSVVGRCELEPREKRCPRADRIAQRFRIAQEVNNLRWRDRQSVEWAALADKQRAVLLQELREAEQIKFDDIRKAIALAQEGKQGRKLIDLGKALKDLPADAEFNYELGGRKELKGHETDARLAAESKLDKQGRRRGGIGKRYWNLPDDVKERIVALLISESTRDDEMQVALLELGLAAEEAEQLAGIELPSARANLSRAAMQRLLPYLEEQGMDLLNKDESRSALHAAGYLPLPVGSQRELLGPVPSGITNPLVRQALFETRQLINGIIRRYGRPGTIRIELAREAKKSFVERKELLFSNKDRERERDAARLRLIEAGMEAPRRNDILKYQLWDECAHTCVYCGKGIGLAQLTGGEANVDHILPRWRSLDNSYMNKVLAHRDCNTDKGDRTPREWLEESQPQRWLEVIARAKKLPKPKGDRFPMRDLVLEDFSARHLTDNAYIARQVHDYLQQLGITVECSRGTITAELRQYWGLNHILGEDGAKNRNDHRHHAVDAAVIALATPALVRELAYARGGGKDGNVKPPWPGLREKLDAAVKLINVSHRPQRRLSGALHEDTFYGATHREDRMKLNVEGERIKPGELGRGHAKDWSEQEYQYAYRKPVEVITDAKKLAEVRDRAIRECLANHLLARGVDPQGKTAYPKGIFEGEKLPQMPSGVPIRKVRLVVEKTTLRPAGAKRGYQFVQPGNNHHIAYYEQDTPKGGKWNWRVVTTWDASLRARRDKLPPVNRMDDPELGRFVMALSIGESFTMLNEAGQEELCVVQKIDSGDGRVSYKLHTDARTAGELKQLNQRLSPERMRKAKSKKVLITHLGELRRAGD